MIACFEDDALGALEYDDTSMFEHGIHLPEQFKHGIPLPEHVEHALPSFEHLHMNSNDTTNFPDQLRLIYEDHPNYDSLSLTERNRLNQQRNEACNKFFKCTKQSKKPEKKVRLAKQWISRDKSCRERKSPDRLGVVSYDADPETLHHVVMNNITSLSDAELATKLYSNADTLLADVDGLYEACKTTKQMLTRSRPALGGRVVLSRSDLPKELIDFIDSKILYGGHYNYKHVTPYTSRQQKNGWGAQIKFQGKLVRVGTFDDEYVAAVCITASLLDKTLLGYPLAARRWLESVVSDKLQLLEWIGLHE